ncbi:MAG: VWA-like domain-containing protein [Bacilli bacterium]
MNINVDNIKRRMLIKYPFFGSVIASLKIKEVNGLGTIGTDGKVIYYDPKFLSDSNEDKQTFLFAHEICHIAFNHILRSGGKDKEIWNNATDAVINHFLERDGLEIPPDGVSEKLLQEKGFDIENVLDYNAEQLYNKLLKKKQEQHENQSSQKDDSDNNEKKSDGQSQEQSENGSGTNSDGSQDEQTQGFEEKDQENLQNQNGNEGTSGQNNSDDEQQETDKNQPSDGNNSSNDENKESQKQDVGHDTHSFWEEALRKHKKSESSDNEQDEKGQSNLEDKSKKDKLQELQEKLAEMGEKEAFKKNDQSKKEQLEELINALSKKSKGTGSGTNSDVLRTNDIGTSKPLIDWRLWLREAISMDVDWSYQNAELEDGVLRPNLEAYPIPETEIVLDTSGSIDKNLLRSFLRECKNILQASRVKVGCFDTQFYGFTEIRTLDDIDNLEYIGGGGTNFNVAVNAFTKRVENKIIFTDGKAPMPSTAINAIWIVFGDMKINPIGGKVIHITVKQLEKLYYHQIDGDFKGKSR